MSGAPTIRRVTLRRLRIPLRQLYVSSMYIMPAAMRTLIEVETSDGGHGFGETQGTDEVVETALRMARAMLGRSPLDRLPLRRAVAGPLMNSRNGRRDWTAYGGLELALWDWTGRHYGMPLHRLLGGNGRTPIEVVCPVPAVILDKPVERAALSGLFADFGRIADVVGYCVDQRRRCGFGCFKYKSTGVSAEWDIRLLRAMREGLGGEIRIRWDPNAAYSPAQAATIAGQLDDLGLEFFEDPTGGTPGMAAVRARVRTPLATNMCVTQFDHLPDALHRHGVDVLLADIYMWGGVQSLVELADVAGLLGFDMAIHSLFETGIGTAANLHMASAFANVRRATDFGLHVLEEEMTQPPLLPVVDGRIAVPDGPGLGVAPDPDAVTRRLVGEAIVIES